VVPHGANHVRIAYEGPMSAIQRLGDAWREYSMAMVELLNSNFNDHAEKYQRMIAAKQRYEDLKQEAGKCE
jgi:hypothetical protein